jgi:hypothetical protein
VYRKHITQREHENDFHPLSNGLSLTSALEANYVGTRTDAPYGETLTLENVNQCLVHLPAYALLNWRGGVAGEGWAANVYVKNLSQSPRVSM